MTEMNETQKKMAIGKAINDANAAADRLQDMGVEPEVVRLVRPLAEEVKKYQETHTQAYLLQLGDKIEVGGHLAEVVGIGEEGLHAVIIHASDLASRVYEIKLRSSHPLTIQRRKKVNSDAGS